MAMKKLLTVAALFLAVSLLAGCGWWQKPATTGEEVVKVGILAPLSGQRADGGEHMKKGAELALAEINNNQESKYQLQLIYEDTQYEPRLAVDGYKKLTAVDKARFIIGPLGSSEVLAVAPLAESEKVLLITPTAQSDDISKAGDYIFRTQTSANLEGPYLANFLSDKLSGKKLAIIGITTDYTESVIKNFQPIFEDKGGVIESVDKLDPKTSDFRTVLAKIKGSQAKTVLIIGTSRFDAELINQTKELGMDDYQIYATSPIESQELLNIAGKNADGVIYPCPYDEESSDSNVKAYRAKYQQKYGEINEVYSANTYDALQLLNMGIQKYGNDPTAIKDFLYTVKDYSGASGKFSFDKNGDVSKPFVLKTVKDGQFVKYEE